jgi:hypothetical protein
MGAVQGWFHHNLDNSLKEEEPWHTKYATKSLLAIAIRIENG